MLRSVLLASIFALLAGMLLLSLLLAVTTDADAFVIVLLQSPGAALLSRFHILAFAIPLYFLLASVVAWRVSVSLVLLRRATALTPALLGAAGVARLLDPSYPKAGLAPLVDFLGQPGAVAVLIAFAAVWAAVVLLWPAGGGDAVRWYHRRAASRGEEHGVSPQSLVAGPRSSGGARVLALPAPETHGTQAGLGAPGAQGPISDSASKWNTSGAAEALDELEALSARGRANREAAEDRDSWNTAGVGSVGLEQHRQGSASALSLTGPGGAAVLPAPEVADFVSDIPEATAIEYRNGAFSEAVDDFSSDSRPWRSVGPGGDSMESDDDYGPSSGSEPSSGYEPEDSDNIGDSYDTSDEAGTDEPGALQIAVQGVLQDHGDTPYWVVDDETRAAAQVLQETLEEFRISAEVTGIRRGPVITMFEILPAPGVKLRNITNLADNIALRLAAASVRIVAPIPGKHAVGIEIPNRNRAIVAFSELINEASFTDGNYRLPVILGRDIPGDAIIFDLARTPHLLIAGATGSGKSVCVNALICSVLYRHHPSEVKLLLIDPKIVELKLYNDIPHLLAPVITEPKRAFQALQYCIAEMERRYALLDSLGVRDIGAYNHRIRERRLAVEKLPYIVVVVDEFADLMATTGKELEATLARLAAMSRAVGIHLVLATQRPSTDVITGLIKANIPSRIAFMVASKVDSRIIIDSIGAEKLLGRGDMLFVSSWDPFPIRLQGAFLSEEEVERVVERVKRIGPPDYIDEEIFFDEDDDVFAPVDEDDPLFNRAVEVVVQARKASASYLQRRLKVGYNRAARLIETMEHKGIVGPANGSKPRDILSVPGELDFG